MNKSVFTYKKSGVDINAAEKFIKFIAGISSKKKGKKKLNNIGGFGSISDIPINIKNLITLYSIFLIKFKYKEGM